MNIQLTTEGIKLIQGMLSKLTPEEQIKKLIECAIHKGEVSDYCDKCLEIELAEKDRQIADLENKTKRIEEAWDRCEAKNFMFTKGIHSLKKENEELEKKISTLREKNNNLEISFSLHSELIEQKLTSRDMEWIGKINGIIMRCEKDGEFSSDYQKHLALGLKRLKQEMGVK